MTEINGAPEAYTIPLHRKEHCRQCDPEGTDRRATRRMKNGQDTVRCLHCGTFLYCIPRTESGIPRRSVKTRPELDLSVRSEVLERDRATCLLCGRGPVDGVILHVAHLVSIADCKQYDVPEEAWNAEYNLRTLCEECNLGEGSRSAHPVHLYARLVRVRHAWVNHPRHNPNV